MNDFKKLANILINGTAGDIKAAKKEIKRLAHQDRSWCQKNRDEYFAVIDNFDRITDAKKQAAFIDATSIFFLCLADDNFDKLKQFALAMLQSPHGHIREAMRKAADWLFISASDRKKDKGARYLQYVRDLEALIDKYPSGSKAKYIDRMPPSINKSLQMVWSRLVESKAYRDIFENNAPEWLKTKRGKLEQNLEHLIIKNSGDDWPDMLVNAIKREIFFEQEAGDFENLLKIIKPDQANLVEAITLCNEAWNYFPHHSLGGKSPVEIVQGSPPEAPLWQLTKDAPNISLNFDNGSLVMENLNQESIFDGKTLIGTGAGGQDDKLRYYFIFTPIYDMDFSKGMARHFEMAAKAVANMYHFDIERMEFGGNYALTTVLIPMDIPAARFGDRILRMIGKGKDKFTKNHYYSGNIAKPGEKEINEYLAYLEKEKIK